MGLAAAEGGLEADDGRGRESPAGRAAERLLEQALQASGGVRVGEEGGWVLVDGVCRSLYDVLELGREHLVAELAGEHVGARLASVEDGLHRLGTSIGEGKVSRSVAGSVPRGETPR
jgi:hypothetical protein